MRRRMRSRNPVRNCIWYCHISIASSIASRGVAGIANGLRWVGEWVGVWERSSIEDRKGVRISYLLLKYLYYSFIVQNSILQLIDVWVSNMWSALILVARALSLTLFSVPDVGNAESPTPTPAPTPTPNPSPSDPTPDHIPTPTLTPLPKPVPAPTSDLTDGNCGEPETMGVLLHSFIRPMSSGEM